MRRALVLGGTGAIGRAPARRLLAAGWQVELTGRMRRAPEIARTIARQLDHTWGEVLLDDAPADGVGRHPWDAAHPIVSKPPHPSSSATSPPATTRRRSRTRSTGSVSAARGGEGSALLPARDDEYFGPLLDYEAEDRRLERS